MEARQKAVNARTIPLAELLNALEAGQKRILQGASEGGVTDIVVDSRKASPGALFVCAGGYPADRHDFLPQAAEAGAVAAIVEEGRSFDAPQNMTLIAVPDTRRALAKLSSRFWEDPSHDLKLYGITGTNGKTTSSFLLSQLLERAGRITGVIGTLGAFLSGEEIPSDRTTPEANDLQRLLREMADRGATAVSMEVSSHALALGRVRGCHFAGAIFTNLTQDHLDFHRSFEDYFQAKASLFTEYAGPDFRAAINLDDEGGKRLLPLVSCPTTTFGISEAADVRAEEIRLSPGSTAFRLAAPHGSREVLLPLIGRFNVSNALGTAALALHAGISLDEVAAGLSEAKGAPGRFERVDEGQPFGVVVDYAHTPDALENVLRAARSITEGRLLCVFGCGGDRDPGKRPKMGRIAGDLSDVAIVTSDNPRSENPEAIIDQILGGITSDSHARVEAIADRREAIRAAAREAKPGDMVLIAGKGHETYQILPHGTIHFDDREEAREALHETV
jgi:UDP-N-acetylmuramoyl-L-alanyl-D-glutamate--2,6-diaminopimelate ligase